MSNPFAVVLGLISAADRLEDLLGDAWPAVRDKLADLLPQVDENPTSDSIQRAVDALLDRLLDGPAADVAREVLRNNGDIDAQRGTAIDTAPAHPAFGAGTGQLIIPVFFATNRRWLGGADPDRWYSSERGSLEYGIVQVSVPARHKLGEIEGPRWWKLQLRANSGSHILMLGLERQQEADFVAQLRASLETSGEPDILVFIHGYNVSFSAAARRAAQIVRDIKFRGQAALYSWPSQGRTAQYVADEASIEASWQYFSTFLQLLIARTGARSVHVIAHSMGNRALLQTLEAFDRSAVPAGSASIGEIVFAAPDVDRDVFIQSAPAFKGRARGFTLYASHNDMALSVSRLFHRFARAGNAGELLLVHDDIDTIDASMADTSLFGLGHSYFSDRRSILNDLHGKILNRLPPDRRFDLELASSQSGTYWSYRE